MLTVLAAALPGAAMFAALAGHGPAAALLAVCSTATAVVAYGEHRHPSTDVYEHATDPEDVTA